MTILTAPSGTTFGDRDVNLIEELGRIGFIRYSERPFRLKSGVDSHVYVFGREELTSNPGVLWDVGSKICEVVRDRMNAEGDSRQPVFIGLPTAGTPLAQSAATADYIEATTGRDACFFQMRSVRKETHGVHENWIIGKPDVKTQRIFRVDNVVTDGGTKFEMAERFAQDGLPTYELDDIILVDRQQGALKRMKEKGFKDPLVIFNLLDLTYVFSKLDIWPADTVEKVKAEIAAHQFD